MLLGENLDIDELIRSYYQLAIYLLFHKHQNYHRIKNCHTLGFLIIQSVYRIVQAMTIIISFVLQVLYKILYYFHYILLQCQVQIFRHKHAMTFYCC